MRKFQKGDFVLVTKSTTAKIPFREVKGEICDRNEYENNVNYRVRYYDVSLRHPNDVWCKAEDMKLCERVNWMIGAAAGV